MLCFKPRYETFFEFNKFDADNLFEIVGSYPLELVESYLLLLERTNLYKWLIIFLFIWILCRFNSLELLY